MVSLRVAHLFVANQNLETCKLTSMSGAMSTSMSESAFELVTFDSMSTSVIYFPDTQMHSKLVSFSQPFKNGACPI